MNEYKNIINIYDVNIKEEKDYERLIKFFGVKELDDIILNNLKYLTGDLHVLLRRKFFYAHRDFDLLLSKYIEGRRFFLYSGRAPSKSKMHIGHLIPFLLTKWFQEKFDVNVYIQIPDEENIGKRRQIIMKK